MLTISNAINIIKLQSYTFDEVMLNSGFNVPITSKQRSYLHIIAPFKDIIRKISKPQTDTLKRQILEETNLLQLNATRKENDYQKVINIINRQCNEITVMYKSEYLESIYQSIVTTSN